MDLVWTGLFAMPCVAPADSAQPTPAVASSGSNATPDTTSMDSALIQSNVFLPVKNAPEAAQTAQINGCVEVYELPKSQAFSIQKAFAQGTDPERTKLLLKLRNGIFPAGVKRIAFGQRACETGQLAEVSLIKEYRYPTEFDNDKSGMAIPAAFETRNLGCSMELNVSPEGKDGTYSTGIEVNTVGLARTDHFQASKSDQHGSITQPIFTTERIKTQVHLIPGIPRLIAAYSPSNDDAAKDDLCLVFVTVSPDK